MLGPGKRADVNVFNADTVAERQPQLVHHRRIRLARILQCAVQRCTTSVGANPTRQMSFQPVAIGTAVEVTNRSKLLV